MAGLRVLLLVLLLTGAHIRAADPPAPGAAATGGNEPLRVGAAAAEFVGSDDMVIAGGIGPGRAASQEGQLRAVAVVLEKKPFKPLAIVACDVLMMTRKDLDPVVSEVTAATGIPAERILINCTHTHHAPSTVFIHGYGPDERFVQSVRAGIVEAVRKAAANLSDQPCDFYFHLGQESSIGQNSRVLLADGQVYWVGPKDGFVRPTGPFDPELAILGFRDRNQAWRAVLFNHSTHTIGARSPGRRSPSFYGLAAQELEKETTGTYAFLEGASGSTHNLNLGCDEAVRRLKEGIKAGLASAQPMPVGQLAALKRAFRYKVRRFDEASEDQAVVRYCEKYAGAGAPGVIEVFRAMRKELAPHQGEERETWLQVLLIGEVALVGVPAEFFTKLGIDIKNRSPFRRTYIAELANDWVGYLPDLDAHKLGGYQVWTGRHSLAEPGTGERIVDEVVEMLRQLREGKTK